MKAASTGLRNFLLANTQCYRATLYTITLIGGTVIRYTDGQSDITFGGNVFSSSASQGAWKRGAIKTVLGLAASTMKLTVEADSTAQINGVAITALIAQKFFQGATVRIESLYMATYGDVSNGSVIDFIGTIGPLDDAGRAGATWTVKSITSKLDTLQPRRLLQPGCSNTLFDAGCTLNRASFAVNKIVAGGSTKSLIIPSVAFSQADGYFTMGTITFTSGANNGVSMTVKIHVSGQLTLVVPLPFAVNAGDTFTVYPGCDKTQATCQNKFSNLVNFEGAPYVPVPETTL